MNRDLAVQDYFVAGGTLWREAPSYIHRPADEELYRQALAGEYCDVLAARQMGKSSLMVRTAERLQASGIRTAILDVSTLGGGISTADAWFFGFLDELAIQLGLDEDVDDWWEAHSNHNPVHRFSNFLRDVLLVELHEPVVVFVDEIDSALGMDFTDDFFAAIRAAYNSRASQPNFQRLTFILLGVARPADLVKDRNRTPYNIGTNIGLNDFTLPELGPFQAVFDQFYPAQGRDIVQWVLNWTNGQPYLTQKICAELIRKSEQPCTQESVEQTVTRLFFTEEARKESNLRAIRDRIESSPHKTRMLQIYEQILSRRPVLDEERSPAKNELKLTGLVRPSARGRLEVRNRIYQKVFDLDWVQRNLPKSPTRRVVILATLLAMLAIVVASYALYRQKNQTSDTYVEQFQTSNSPDVKLTSLARLFELDDRSISEAQDLYNGLSHDQKLSLYTELSSPQNVSGELVTVVEAVYQDNENNQDGNEILSAMRTVLGQVGAAGAPSLKTEIEFWLKGREEADGLNPQTAASFYDSAWAESVARGHSNYSVRFDRAMALIAQGSYGPAFDDLQAVWGQAPSRQGSITALINAHPRLSVYFSQNPGANPDILARLTPVVPTRVAVEPQSPNPPPTITPLPAIPQSLPSTLTPTSGEISPYSGWIAYALGEGTGREIFMLNPATGTQKQITNNGVVDEGPSFSPDAWQIAYASNRSQGGWELYAYDLRLGTERQLTAFDGEARFPLWSPVMGDARILFQGRTFETQAVINIWMLDSATGKVEQLTNSGADSGMSWSPDGIHILFGRATKDTTRDGRITTNDALDIFSLDLASREKTNLTNTPDINEFSFDWSPDGQWIAFTRVQSDVNGDGMINLSDSQDLFMMRSDGSDIRRLDLGRKQVFSPTWSPDGRFILVLVNYAAGQNEIWRYDTQNGNFWRISARGPLFHPTYAK